jgi:hypothetical protein
VCREFSQGFKAAELTHGRQRSLLSMSGNAAELAIERLPERGSPAVGTTGEPQYRPGYSPISVSGAEMRLLQ